MVEALDHDDPHSTPGASGGSDNVEDEGLGGSETRIDRPPSAKGGRRGGRGRQETRPSHHQDPVVPSDEPLAQGPVEQPPLLAGGGGGKGGGASDGKGRSAANRSPSPPAPPLQGPAQGLP